MTNYHGRKADDSGCGLGVTNIYWLSLTQNSYREYDGWLTGGHMRVQFFGDLDDMTELILAKIRRLAGLDDARVSVVDRYGQLKEVGL